MFFTRGSLQDLLIWFRQQDLFEYVLLFAAGDLNSREFIASVFRERATIDLLSSMHVAVFLSCANLPVAVELPTGEGAAKFLGCELLAETSPRKPWYFLLPHFTPPPSSVRITDLVAPALREVGEVVGPTITFTHQILQHFDLAVTDLPALILLHHWSPDPLVIHTYGQEDVRAVVDFLRDLDRLRLRCPQIKTPKQRKDLVARLHRGQAALQQARVELTTAVAACRNYLIANGFADRTA